MIQVKAVNHGHKIEELLRLHQLIFKNNMPLNYWQWKHFKNPLNVYEPEAIVAIEQNRIVGASIFMPLEIKLGSMIIRVAQACDGMVHPDYRRKGVFFQVIDYAGNYYANQGYQLIYAFANTYSLAGVMKVGWKNVCRVDQLIFVNNPARMIARKIHNPPVIKLSAFLWSSYQKCKLNRYANKSNHFSIKEYHSYPEALKGIDNLYRDNSIELVRKEEFLRWRFDQHPLFKYQYLLAFQGKTLVGYMVTTNVQKNGFITGKIVDYLIKDDDLDCFSFLIDQAISRFQRNNCDIVLIWEGKEQFRKKLFDYNFKSLSTFPYQKFVKESNLYFTVQELNPGVSNNIDIYDGINWYLKMVYSDTN